VAEVGSQSRDGTKCPVCGVGTLHDAIRTESTHYRGREFASKEPGAYCDNCGDGIAYANPDGERAWVAFRQKVDAEERAELAAIRARLHLTQEEASKLSGGGHNAFSRYERGEAQPVMGVILLFRLLDRHPYLLQEVQWAGDNFPWRWMTFANSKIPTVVMRAHEALVFLHEKEPLMRLGPCQVKVDNAVSTVLAFSCMNPRQDWPRYFRSSESEDDWHAPT
jgi:HTH-type transcriptional regulator / antitoxin MqsA